MRFAVPSVASHPSAISSHAHLPKVRGHAEADGRQTASPFDKLLDGVGAAADAASAQPAERSSKAERRDGVACGDQPADADARPTAAADKDAKPGPHDIADKRDPAKAESATDAKDQDTVRLAKLVTPGVLRTETQSAAMIGAKSESKPHEKSDTTIDTAIEPTKTEAATDAGGELKPAFELVGLPVPAPVQDAPTAPAVAAAPSAVPAAPPTAPAAPSAIPDVLPTPPQAVNDAVAAHGPSPEIEALASLPGGDKRGCGRRPARADAATCQIRRANVRWNADNRRGPRSRTRQGRRAACRPWQTECQPRCRRPSAGEQNRQRGAAACPR